MFVIDGEEYFGKSLAADKLKEAVEEIGFRYIDVKKMYKNFKGSLKEQTERIAYTNQYDGLFLIGAKTSDSEKIFSFLFNTENIALAIAQAKETMQEMAKEHKEKQEELIDINEQLRLAKIQVEYYIKMYYVKLLEEFNELGQTKQQLSIKVKNSQDLLEKIQLFTSLVEGASWLYESSETINNLRNKDEYNNTQIGLIEKITDLIDTTYSIKGFIELERDVQNYYFHKENIDQLIPKLQSLIDYSNYLILENNINELREKLSSYKNKKHELNKDYNLCECSQCSGLGVMPSQ
jgi:hypothetical protein